ncbi:lipopolysaccharide biosynthesis protein [Segatella bryantii]|uniref:glycosyl transferase family 90 n=1 Tax=Segatella bryantii TaxID=77095 RepID=UPI001EDAD8A6|nr:glycosyl transferase family 90 [Segatella bryantii]UKK74352.1 lipopolysaccharide biosynthesis protein [Segatella bryantii]
MNKRKIYYTLHSGKNSKLKYYILSYLSIYTPHWLKAWNRRRILKSLDKREDKAYILDRVNYYNQLTCADFQPEKFQEKSLMLKDQLMTGQKVYYLDSYSYAKSFPLENRWCLLPGDITYIPEVPSIVKSRPLQQNQENSVLLNLDKVRHFLFVHDKKKWAEKKDMVIFRGMIQEHSHSIFKKNRYDFMKMYYGDALCNLGVIDKQYPEWYTEKLTIGEHLDYKFIMALEGNDVASNLKWIMSSNSIAVMPRPTCETWFMEGKLIPNYHYIEIKPDFSDLKERIAYYLEHPKEAEAIVCHAHEYINQFRNRKRENLISYLVLQKYFDITNA